MDIVNKTKFWLTGVYIWLRIKLLARKYKVPEDKIFYAYTNLYHHFPNVIMILDRCMYDKDRDFEVEVKSAIKSKEMLEEYDRN